MKKHSLLYLLLFIVLLILAACGAGTEDASDADAEPTAQEPALEDAPELTQPEAEEDVIPRVTITPYPAEEAAEEADDGAYPAVELPSPTPFPEGYPMPEAGLPPAQGYPVESDTTWVIKPAGEQCADTLNFETEQEATASLEAAGIDTLSVQTIDLPVAAVCGGATSTHYAVEIGPENVETAESLEWTAVPAEDLTVWVLIPAGTQCQDPDYASEKDAVASLEAAGIQTFSSQTIEMMVTSSCSSPTSTQYAVEISLADAKAAEAADWRVVPATALEGN